MEKLLKNLLAVLDAQTDLYRALLKGIERENEAAVASDLSALNKTSKVKENLLLKIRILEEQRIRITGNIAEALGRPDKKLTLSEISRLISEPLGWRLEECRRTLGGLIRSIETANAQNKALMVHSLEFVRGAMSLLGDLMTPNPVYYPNGRIRTGGQNGRIISGAV